VILGREGKEGTVKLTGKKDERVSSRLLAVVEQLESKKTLPELLRFIPLLWEIDLNMASLTF